MPVRRVFVVSGAGLTAHHRHGAKLLDPFSFDTDEEGLAQFVRYLERFPDEAAWVIADVVEEEFREETIPHVLAWERRALIRGKAARAFPGACWFHATRLGRDESGRRDERVLLSAITRPEALAPWLAPMVRHRVPLAGICSPAILTATLLKAIEARGDHLLVVSFQSGGGLRQTSFRHGKLHLSRLAALPDSTPGESASRVLAEVERTRRYLGTLRTRSGHERLEVHVLSHGEPLDALRRALRRDAGDEARAGYRVVDLATAARRLGMRGWGGESTADRLFVHLLATGRSGNHYATADQRQAFAMLRIRSFLKTASAALISGACLFSGVVALEGAAASGDARSLALLAALYEGRYREARAALPPAPAEPAELARVVSVVNALRARSTDPVDLLALISNALAGFPRVRIEGLSWRSSDDAKAPVGEEDGARIAPRPRDEERRRDPESLFQIARISARIEPFDGDYRAAIDTVRRFAAALAAPAGVEHVRILTLPLELSSEHSLSGAAGATPEAAEFEIRVALRAAVPGGAET